MARHDRIKLIIDSRLSDVRLVGASVRSIGLAAGFDDRDAGMLQLALEEALTNVIRHGYQERPGHPVEVEVNLRPDRMTFVVTHQGEGMRSWPPKTDQPPDPTQEGGRGIFLINAIMDSVRYSAKDGRTCITLIKRRAAK